MDEKNITSDVAGKPAEMTSFKCSAAKGDLRMVVIALLTSAIVVAIYHFTMVAASLLCAEAETPCIVYVNNQDSDEAEAGKRHDKHHFSPEKRERFKNMTPEQREEFRKRGGERRERSRGYRPPVAAPAAENK